MVPFAQLLRPGRSVCPSLFILCLVIGCGGGDTSVAPVTGITVITTTNRGVVDPDGYTVQVGSSASATVGINGFVVINGLQPGTESVSLGGIAPNCVVTSANPQTAQIQAGHNTTLAFDVVCTALPGGSYRIAFMVTYDDPNAFFGWEIYTMNSDGSVVRLTNNRFFDGYPTWSPDGQKIVFASDRDGSLGIYVMNQDGSNVVRLTNAAANVSDRFPSWSPDGTKILFESNRDGDTEIYVMNADGSNVAQLTNNATGDTHPQFSPDGSKIVFVTNRDAAASQPPFSKWEIYEMSTDGTGARRVTSDGAIAEFPSYYSNGTKILFDGDRLSTVDVNVMNTDGSGITRLTNLATNFLPVGSPDQSHIMFTSSRTGHFEIWVMNADGSGVEPLTWTPTNGANVGWSYRR